MNTPASTALTADFSKMCQGSSLDPRNVQSTIKKKRPKFVLAPLNLDEIRQQIEDADREFNQNPAPVSYSPILEENEENSPKHKISHDLEMAVSLDTTAPVKPKNLHDSFALAKPRAKPAQNLFVTPKNTLPPKIRCSVKTSIQTPSQKICQSQSKQQKEPIYANPSDETFKRLHIKGTEYIILNNLGKGGSSEVLLCYQIHAKVLRAVKCVNLTNATSAEGFVNEVELLKSLQHCNRVIKMYDSELNQEQKVLLVVLEVGGADLHMILKDGASSRIPTYMLIYYWLEMLYAVQQIHSNGIVHADLKPANFLKTEKYLKLIDFGISTRIQDDMTSVCKAVAEGSFHYISPEALRAESSSNVASPNFGRDKFKLSFKSDVWSLGCILYQLVYGTTPFAHIKHPYAKIEAIMDPNHTIRFPDRDSVPPRIIVTMKKCLKYDMRTRPSVQELLAEYESVSYYV